MDQKLIRKWGDDYKKIHDKSCDFYYYGKNPQGPMWTPTQCSTILPPTSIGT